MGKSERREILTFNLVSPFSFCYEIVMIIDESEKIFDKIMN